MNIITTDLWYEEWKDTVESFQVSSKGNVKSSEGISIKHIITLNGYHRIHIKGKMYLVHRLVAEAFLPNPNGLTQVDHINGDKDNNNVENLKWCDEKINGSNINTKAKNHTYNKPTPVRCVETGQIFNSFKDASRWCFEECNAGWYGNKDIKLCCDGKRKTYKGYHWEYI